MTITLSQLESHLWESANILRGPFDAADFKSYVFPLLFFKRISDVHDDEYAIAMKAFDGDEESARGSRGAILLGLSTKLGVAQLTLPHSRRKD